MSEKIRLYGSTHKRLKAHNRDEETLHQTLERIIPEDAEVVEHPKTEIVPVRVGDDLHQEILNLAGQNVNASEVVAYYISRYRRAEAGSI